MSLNYEKETKRVTSAYANPVVDDGSVMKQPASRRYVSL